MDEKEETPSPEYLTGFNQGYLIAKHMPEIAAKLPTELGDSERSHGFKDGKAEYEAEKGKERTPDWMKKDAFTNLDKNSKYDKNKNKDDLERE